MLGILVWQEGGERVVAVMAIGAIALVLLATWLVRRKRQGKLALIDPDLFSSPYFRLGISSQTMQQVALGGMMIALPIYLQMVLEYNALQAGLSLAPLSLSMFFVALLAGKRAGNRRPASIIRIGFLLLAARRAGACSRSSRARIQVCGWRSRWSSRARVWAARVAAQQLHAGPDLPRSASARRPA